MEKTTHSSWKTPRLRQPDQAVLSLPLETADVSLHGHVHETLHILLKQLLHGRLPVDNGHSTGVCTVSGEICSVRTVATYLRPFERKASKAIAWSSVSRPLLRLHSAISRNASDIHTNDQAGRELHHCFTQSHTNTQPHGVFRSVRIEHTAWGDSAVGSNGRSESRLIWHLRQDSVWPKTLGWNDGSRWLAFPVRETAAVRRQSSSCRTHRNNRDDRGGLPNTAS